MWDSKGVEIMKKTNKFIMLAISGGIAVCALIPLNALASIPHQKPILVRELTLQDKQFLNGGLRAEFKDLDREIRVQFAEILKQATLMGFYKGARSTEMTRDRMIR